MNAARGLLLSLAACAGTPAVGSTPPGLLYRLSVGYSPCPSSGCAHDETVVSERGVLTSSHSDAASASRTIPAAQLDRFRAAVRAHPELFASHGLEATTADAVGTCEVWLDGKHASFEFSSPWCGQLATWLDPACTGTGC